MSSFLPCVPLVDTNDLQKVFSENLVTRRKEKGYTQDQIANFLGVTKKTYRSWEKDALPKSTELFNLANILECDIDYLFGKITTDTHIRNYIDTYFSLSYQAFDKLMLLSSMKDTNSSRIASDISWILEYLIVTPNGNKILDLIRLFAFGIGGDNVPEINLEYDLTVKALLNGSESYYHISQQDATKKIVEEHILNSISNHLKEMGLKHNRAYIVKPDNPKIMPPVD